MGSPSEAGARRSHSFEDIEEDGVENLLSVVDLRATDGFGSRQVWLKVGPFSIGEVGSVCCSHTR